MTSREGAICIDDGLDISKCGIRNVVDAVVDPFAFHVFGTHPRDRPNPEIIAFFTGRSTANKPTNLRKWDYPPPHRIGDGVAEEVEEGGLEEDVELGEGLAAFGPQGVRRIQNPRNPLLLGERRKGDLE